jgi:hypothetical protein
MSECHGLVGLKNGKSPDVRLKVYEFTHDLVVPKRSKTAGGLFRHESCALPELGNAKKRPIQPYRAHAGSQETCELLVGT